MELIRFHVHGIRQILQNSILFELNFKLILSSCMGTFIWKKNAFLSLPPRRKSPESQMFKQNSFYNHYHLQLKLNDSSCQPCGLNFNL